LILIDVVSNLPTHRQRGFYARLRVHDVLRRIHILRRQGVLPSIATAE